MFAHNTLPVSIGIIPVFLICSASAIAQTTWIVDQGGGGDFTTIQGCIDDPSVVDGDTCLVSSGTYMENLSVSGKAIDLLSMGGPDDTVIDGGGAGPVVTFEDGAPGPLNLEGFTIRGGYSEGSSDPAGLRGAGIQIGCVSAVIRDCLITQNSGNIGAYTVYVDCLNEFKSVEIENCRVIDNPLDGIISRSGSKTVLEISDSEISANSGNGIRISSGSIYDCQVQNNTPVTYSDAGIYADGYYDGDITISRCYVSGNGSGIYGLAYYGDVTISNTVMTGNEVGLAGYTYHNTDGRIRLYHCTISGNTYAIGNGGGDPGPRAYIYNSIVWGDLMVLVHLEEVKYSDFKGGFQGEGNINVDPSFVAPDDFHLSPFSWCIDRASGLYGVDEDYEGSPRPQGGGYDMGAYESAPGGGCSMQEAQAASIYETPEEVRETLRGNSLLTILLVPVFTMLVLKGLAKTRMRGQ